MAGLGSLAELGGTDDRIPPLFLGRWRIVGRHDFTVEDDDAARVISGYSIPARTVAKRTIFGAVSGTFRWLVRAQGRLASKN